MKIEDRLFLVKHNPDKESHLGITDQAVCGDCADKPCLYFCPAQVYSWSEALKHMLVSYEGCFECGACRIGCPQSNITWRFPRGGCGVAFRFG